jgi:mercuric reductase
VDNTGVSESFDLVVLGGGSAGRDAALQAHDLGARVAIVESVRWGGSCPNVACRPTKAYLVAAEQMHDVNVLAQTRGVRTGPAPIDMEALRLWKDSLRRDQAGWFELLSGRYEAVIKGEASFVDAQTVRVDERELRADKILIATGSRTVVPPVPGLDEIAWLDHVSALALERVPESLLIVGGGPVGLEFAQIFARFGSRVTIVNRDAQIAARADHEAAAELQAALEDEGIEVIPESTLDGVRRDASNVVVTVGERELRVTDVLLASGRTGNTQALQLERAGVEAERGQVVVDEHQRTTADGIWAAGDVAAGPMFTPAAQYQARVAVADMFRTGERRAEYDVFPTAIFTDPELGSVGLTEDEARAAGYDVDAVKHDVKSVTRAQYSAEKRGLYKLVFDRTTRRVLGIHVVARAASDIVGGLAVALMRGATIEDFALVHHVYPSMSEGVKAAAEQALRVPAQG